MIYTYEQKQEIKELEEKKKEAKQKLITVINELSVTLKGIDTRMEILERNVKDEKSMY